MVRLDAVAPARLPDIPLERRPTCDGYFHMRGTRARQQCAVMTILDCEPGEERRYRKRINGDVINNWSIPDAFAQAHRNRHLQYGE